MKKKGLIIKVNIDYSNLPDEGKKIEYKKNTSKLSRDIWETISAFENCDGGIIILGIDQEFDSKGNTINHILGVTGVHQILDDFWSTLDETISYSTISNNDVNIFNIENKHLIEISVKSAPDAQKPIYANGTPYVRKGATDLKAKKDDLKILVTNSSDSLDTEVLKNFKVDDLDEDSILLYRSHLTRRAQYKSYKELSIHDFLTKIGVISKDYDRDGQEGITSGGLLFFGNNNAILHKFPNFQLDYFDASTPTERWISRVSSITDNLNIYSFFVKASESLFRTVKNSFELDKDLVRKDTSGIMEVAIREALINMLMHANYYDSVPIKAVSHINYYEFTNPGKMKIPVQDFFTTNNSSTRNPIISKLFVQLGLGERAGHGGEKIYESALLNNYREPEITTNSHETKLKIWKVDYADSFSGQEITDRERLILKAIITSPTQSLSHKEIEQITKLSYSKTSRSLNDLKNKKIITSSGNARSTRYLLAFSKEQMMAKVQAIPNILREVFKNQN